MCLKAKASGSSCERAFDAAIHVIGMRRRTLMEGIVGMIEFLKVDLLKPESSVVTGRESDSQFRNTWSLQAPKPDPSQGGAKRIFFI